MAALATYDITLAGTEQVLVAAAAGGDTVEARDDLILVVKNAHASQVRTVTLNSIRPSDYGTDVNPAIVVPALKTYFIKVDDVSRFRDSATGRVGVSYSDAAADLTVGAFGHIR